MRRWAAPGRPSVSECFSGPGCWSTCARARLACRVAGAWRCCAAARGAQSALCGCAACERLLSPVHMFLTARHGAHGAGDQGARGDRGRARAARRPRRGHRRHCQAAHEAGAASACGAPACRPRDGPQRMPCCAAAAPPARHAGRDLTLPCYVAAIIAAALEHIGQRRPLTCAVGRAPGHGARQPGDGRGGRAARAAGAGGRAVRGHRRALARADHRGRDHAHGRQRPGEVPQGARMRSAGCAQRRLLCCMQATAP